MNLTIHQLSPNEYPAYYQTYFQEIETSYTLVEELEISMNNLVHFVQNVPLEKIDYQYAEGKWTLKEIILHIIDCERVFGYRAMRIARRDATPLPGFDENAYVPNSYANNRTLKSLLEEFLAVRQATISLFKSFQAEQLTLTGTASGYTVSVRAIGFVCLAHQAHHLNIYQKRYLN